MGDFADAQPRVHLRDAGREGDRYRGREIREAERGLALEHNSTTRRSSSTLGSPPEDLIASSVRNTASIASLRRGRGIFSATQRNCPIRKNGCAPPSSASAS